MSMEHLSEIGIDGIKGIQSVELGETPGQRLELSGKTILRISMSPNQRALLGIFDRDLTTGDYYGSEHIQSDLDPGGLHRALQALHGSEDLLRSDEVIIEPSRPGS
jgi:hypothetical protein